MSNNAESKDASSSSAGAEAPMTLSTGAIAGIAIGGAIVLFVGFAFFLVKLARRQDERRRVSAFSTFPDDLAESGQPNRLRKKSIVGDQAVGKLDHEDDDVGREESHSRRSSINVISPARTRQGSFSMGGESRRDSIETTQTQGQRQKSRSPDKQRGYGMYQHRRKTSWIDEDALHGPTITSPQRTKQKHKRKVSWFDGGLGRSLSRLSTRSGMGEKSPTLPYTEGGRGEHKFTTPAASPGERGSQELAHAMQASRYASTPQQSPQRHQQQTYTSPQKSYGPSSNPSPTSGSNNPSQSPPDIVQNPRYRDRVSFQAAQRLAGTARLPAPISIPQQGGQPQRQPLHHSVTDTGLTEILRMTAERLQDGNRSERRQTLMIPYTPRRMVIGETQFGLGPGIELRDLSYYEPEEEGDVSPAKSHRSAPATLSYAELEGSTPTHQSPQRHAKTPGHSRHISHISQVSIISEADSLVASKRESIPEVRTALSSPSRNPRSAEPSPSPQAMHQQPPPGRPFSDGSTMSSALSTLYSMEEASIRSPPADESQTETPKRAPEKVRAAFDVLTGKSNPRADGDVSPKTKLRFDDEEVPPPLRIRRGTLGGITSTLPTPRPTSNQNTRSLDPAKRKSSFAIHAMNGNDDPFYAVATPQNPAHITPVSSPTRRMVMPSPRTILNSPSNLKRAPSPAVSEAGLSSVYDSYTYNHDLPMETGDGSNNTTTASEPSPAKSTNNSNNSSKPRTGRESRLSFRNPETQPKTKTKTPPQPNSSPKQQHQQPTPKLPGSPIIPRRGMPSDSSFYSQESDTVPALRSSNSNSNSNTSTSTQLQRSARSVRMSNTITELRRMNSQISTVSSSAASVSMSMATSPTLPVMRGGGFSPGRHGGGGRNYLALGLGIQGGGNNNNKGNGNGNEAITLGADATAAVGTRGKVVSSNLTSNLNSLRRGNNSISANNSRARRGTVVLQGLDPKMGGQVATVMGSGGVKNYNTSQLLTPAEKLKQRESTYKRSSVESLYDEKGFLKLRE
ncbi:hypothetical protein M426DRAFT_260938 [Hypoxylon sp. CI-4A]|nr:hypothetical protein M426DRAFT_260938 [Hypoxylon sp. CI-4A]